MQKKFRPIRTTAEGRRRGRDTTRAGQGTQPVRAASATNDNCAAWGNGLQQMRQDLFAQMVS